MQHDSTCTAVLIRSPFAEPFARASAAIHELALAIARRTEPPKPTQPGPPEPERPRRDALPLALALQGGGALGAFTWGVLDRLLEVPRFSPRAISGASAGAANAVVMASGWMAGGAEGAKEALDHFWHRVGMLPSLWRRVPSVFGFDPTVALEMASALVSPYDFNPLNHNPLKPIIAELTDFERLRSTDAPPIFISATDVGTGRARIFDNSELQIDAVLASSCLPHLFQAVELEGRTYWDGGYTSNPPIDPLRRFLSEAPLMLVLVNPTRWTAVPRTARDIGARLGQVLGNASVWRELETVPDYESIALPEQQSAAAPPDKLNHDWRYIQSLRDEGRAAAESWLAMREAAAPA